MDLGDNNKEITLTAKDEKLFMTNIKIGILKQLYSQGLFTDEQLNLLMLKQK